MQKKLIIMTKWLGDSGLIVNETKTELCLFSKSNHIPIDIVFNNVTIRSKNTIIVPGIMFDSQLKRDIQVSQSIRKAKSALHGIKLIKKYFDKTELKQLLTSNYYSILYYNSKIWHLPTLNTILKRQLLSASAAGLKLISQSNDIVISHERLHTLNARATPAKMMTYKLALQLYKSCNDHKQNDTWMSLNLQQTFNNRCDTISIVDTSRNKIGRNQIVNRMNILNGKIKHDWMNLNIDSYKLKCKNIFLN